MYVSSGSPSATPNVQLTYAVDNEFTQLMKGLQGERLRQAFKHLDTNEDGFILPDQFKRIVLVRATRTLGVYEAF